MTERAREAGASGASLRCPFCHDSIGEADGERVDCSECNAAHHASCVVESGQCAATGCGSDLVRLNERVVTVHELAFAKGLAAPSDEASLRLRPVGYTLVALALAAATSGILWFGWARGTGAPLLVVLALAMLASAALVNVVSATRRRNARDPQRERELLADIGVLIPDPTAQVLHELRRTPAVAPPPANVGPRPSRCPSCKADVGAESEDDAWFCHHCGASLAPEEPKGA